MGTPGIYKIQSKVKPERIYVGSSINIEKRKRLHLKALRGSVHHSKKLQSHFNKYSEDDLMFSTIIECNKEDLVKHEQFFIDALNPWFNCSPTAGSPLGVKRSEETKELLRKINTGRKGTPMSPEHKERLRTISKNRIVSVETKRLMSEAKKGYKPSEETKQKLREAMLQNGNKPPNAKGRIVSEETRKKLRRANKGHIPWCAGRKMGLFTEDHRKKLRESHKGPRPWRKGKRLPLHTGETRKKMREAQLKRWELIKQKRVA